MPSVPDLVAQIYENVGTGLPPQEIPGQLVLPPPCHIPHKNWATEQEAEDYFNIERWAFRLHSQPFPVTGLLHIPYKNWANDQEANNYDVMERWALDTQVHGYTYVLHFPFKRWAYDADRPDAGMEEDNYRYLESWALGFAGYPGRAGVGQPP